MELFKKIKAEKLKKEYYSDCSIDYILSLSDEEIEKLDDNTKSHYYGFINDYFLPLTEKYYHLLSQIDNSYDLFNNNNYSDKYFDNLIKLYNELLLILPKYLRFKELDFKFCTA